jgi:hypothetical protein
MPAPAERTQLSTLIALAIALAGLIWASGLLPH